MISGMGRKSALSSLFAATAVLVAGCDSAVGVEDAGSRHDAGTSAAVATTTTPVAAPPPAGSPTAATSSAPAGPVRLKPADASGLTFEWRESGSGATGTITIDVLGPSGARVQRITEPNAELRQTLPTLQDTDGDGRDELIVPVTFGPYWTRNIVYRAGDDGQFTRAGDITGSGFTPTTDGYSLVSKRNPPTQWNYTFMVYENGVLVPVIEVAERTPVTDANNRVTEKDCVIEQLPSLAATGYASREAARQHFCAEIPAIR